MKLMIVLMMLALIACKGGPECLEKPAPATTATATNTSTLPPGTTPPGPTVIISPGGPSTGAGVGSGDFPTPPPAPEPEQMGAPSSADLGDPDNNGRPERIR